ncbi:hypothetical protein GYMLUDRAFT_76185 [Collybiopsis luxurians FD-317 M1]|uniref:Uncharacterized protein n=1 Tax=Collybiopsis luxurians FD-317 M1 TaxID=944289 RepID=A0A0D0CM10_9AGAR|nr:hypothetical protein GYMLUDRAFT_76185 [Collybiopsis luxurians FD-317 M1]
MQLLPAVEIFVVSFLIAQASVLGYPVQRNADSNAESSGDGQVENILQHVPELERDSLNPISVTSKATNEIPPMATEHPRNRISCDPYSGPCEYPT